MSVLGIEKNKLFVTGSIKFDIQISDDVKEKSKILRQELGQNRPVWIAASTHKGEDEQVLVAHKRVLESHPDALLILVPRHPERFDDMYDLCQQQGFETVRRTTQENVANSTQVYLGDTMGEMLLLLGAADICFMGGSLVGDKVGGHNVLEPAALGIPVVTGSSYYNFTEIVKAMRHQETIMLIENSQQLSLFITSLLRDDNHRFALSKKTTAFVAGNAGALNKTLKGIEEHS